LKPLNDPIALAAGARAPLFQRSRRIVEKAMPSSGEMDRAGRRALLQSALTNADGTSSEVPKMFARYLKSVSGCV
jgi:hypothetical protein